eukprot:PhF_6_TR7049/c0_g1_i2/m.10605
MIDDATREIIEKEIDDLQQYSERLVDDIYHTKQLQDAVIRDIDATRREIANVAAYRQMMKKGTYPHSGGSGQQHSKAAGGEKSQVPSTVPPLALGVLAGTKDTNCLSSGRETMQALEQRQEEYKKAFAQKIDQLRNKPQTTDFHVPPPPPPGSQHSPAPVLRKSPKSADAPIRRVSYTEETSPPMKKGSAAPSSFSLPLQAASYEEP